MRHDGFRENKIVGVQSKNFIKKIKVFRTYLAYDYITNRVLYSSYGVIQIRKGRFFVSVQTLRFNPE